jgi:hypothetical protein
MLTQPQPQITFQPARTPALVVRFSEESRPGHRSHVPVLISRRSDTCALKAFPGQTRADSRYTQPTVARSSRRPGPIPCKCPFPIALPCITKGPLALPIPSHIFLFPCNFGMPSPSWALTPPTQTTKAFRSHDCHGMTIPSHELPIDPACSFPLLQPSRTICAPVPPPPQLPPSRRGATQEPRGPHSPPRCATPSPGRAPGKPQLHPPYTVAITTVRSTSRLEPPHETSCRGAGPCSLVGLASRLPAWSKESSCVLARGSLQLGVSGPRLVGRGELNPAAARGPSLEICRITQGLTGKRSVARLDDATTRAYFWGVGHHPVSGCVPGAGV